MCTFANHSSQSLKVLFCSILFLSGEEAEESEEEDDEGKANSSYVRDFISTKGLGHELKHFFTAYNIKFVLSGFFGAWLLLKYCLLP